VTQTQTDNPTVAPQSLSATARFAWLALILATLYFCYFHNLGALGLVGPDEPRYAWIARDMAETGDWVTPRLYGKPWFEKPPLYYWGAALSFKLFGVSEVSARLPSALAALLATLAMAWLAWRAYGAETARWLLLLLPTTIGMIGFSHAAATDMPFAAMLTIAVVFAAQLLHLLPTPASDSSTSLTSSTSFTSFLFGFFLALAALAKGPAAIVLPGGAVLLWAIFTKRWRDAFRCLHPLAIIAFCVTALPWYFLCARRNPDFFRVFIIEHNFQRYLTPEFQHIRPFWFYLPILLIAFIPWTLLLCWSCFDGFTSLWKRCTFSLAFFLLCSASFCIIFFSLSNSKLPGYILPTIPPVGLLLARSYVVFSRIHEKSLRWLLTALSIVSLPVALILVVFGRRFHSSPTTGPAMIAAACVLLAFALANLLLTINANFHGIAIAPASVIPVLALLLLFHQISHPWLRRDASGKTLAAELRAAQVPTQDLYVASMKRAQQYSLSFYLHCEIPSWNPGDSNEAHLLLPSRNCQDVVKPPQTCSAPLQLGSTGWFLYRVEGR
jgi:4-amino-4-deoxy-L-arabinose transferase-like glycosyltransferase